MRARPRGMRWAFTTDPDALRALAQALQALVAKLTEAQAQQAFNVAASSLAWAASEPEAAEWARALVALLPRATDKDGTRELVRRDRLSDRSGTRDRGLARSDSGEAFGCAGKPGRNGGELGGIAVLSRRRVSCAPAEAGASRAGQDRDPLRRYWSP